MRATGPTSSRSSSAAPPALPPARPRDLLLAAAAYALLALVFTWPAVTQLRTHLLAGAWDGPMFLWNTWWGPHALFERGEDPLSTRELFFPAGTSLVVNSHALLPALASWPLQKAFGLVPAFNLMVLASFVLAGLGGLLFARELSGDGRAGFVAGAVFAFCHLRVSKVIFFNLFQSWLLAFWAWALWRAWRSRSPGRACAAGVIGAMTFWTDYNLAVLAALWGAAFAVHALIDSGRLGLSRGALLRDWGLMALVLAVLSLPLLLRLRGEYLGESGYVNVAHDESAREATPWWRLLAWGDLDRAAQEQHLPLRQAAFLGYATLLLAGSGAWSWRRRRETWFLGLAMLLFLLLALGPELNLGRSVRVGEEQDVHVPLPYRWLSHLPVLGEIRVAHRFGVLAGLAIAALAALGVRELLQRLAAVRLGASRIARDGALLLACGAVMADFTCLPFPVRTALPPIEPVLRSIAEDPRDCAVLQWPGGRLGDPFFAYYSTVIGKPVYLDGSIARLPASLQQRRLASRLGRVLIQMLEAPGEAALASSVLVRGAQAELREQRIGWIMLSQLDRELLFRSRDPWRPERLRELDARLRATFPEAERAWIANEDALERSAAALSRGRWSDGTLFAVYRVRLP